MVQLNIRAIEWNKYTSVGLTLSVPNPYIYVPMWRGLSAKPLYIRFQWIWCSQGVLCTPPEAQAHNSLGPYVHLYLLPFPVSALRHPSHVIRPQSPVTRYSPSVLNYPSYTRFPLPVLRSVSRSPFSVSRFPTTRSPSSVTSFPSSVTRYPFSVLHNGERWRWRRTGNG